MSKIVDSKNALIQVIIDSDIYKRYEKVKMEMRAYPEKKAIVDSYRERSYMIAVDGGEQYDVAPFLEERERLRDDSLITEYLDAELALCRMLQRISMDIMNVADLEIDSFSDRIRT